MQQRRLGPGDVLDDYCPRERRVTDHAIVAMIDDTIQQTRCVVCDAEHDYKHAKVPPQRKKKAPALFNQVLDGLKAPARPAHAPDIPDEERQIVAEPDVVSVPDVMISEPLDAPVVAADVPDVEAEAPTTAVDVPPPEARPADPADGPLFRRQLIRAALPRPDGTTPPARVIPEFTIRQPAGRHRHGGRRRGQGQGQGFNGPMRFGRDGFGPRSNGHGRSGGHSRQGGQGGQGGHGNQGGPGGNRSRGPRRGGKKR